MARGAMILEINLDASGKIVLVSNPARAPKLPPFWDCFRTCDFEPNPTLSLIDLSILFCCLFVIITGKSPVNWLNLN